MKLTKEDKIRLQEKGISEQQLEEQLVIFKKGIPFVDLREPATVGHGIYKFSSAEEDRCITHFENLREDLDLLKFTPASGAATRMFKFLFEFLEDYKGQKESVNAYINRTNAQDLRLFFVGLDSFPFYRMVREKMLENFKNSEETDVDKNRLRFVKTMLKRKGLNYGNYPKGLFPFHKYKDHNASAFEEHLFEASLYAKRGDRARLHFTISEQHYTNFKAEFERIQHIVEEKTQTQFEISYSFQEPHTDTVAVTPENKIFRDDQGQIVFRPGGHGALINNLNKQEADIVFIKNVDNVVVFRYEEEVARYKKVLAGKLLELQEKSFGYLKLLDAEAVNEDQVIEIVHFLQDEFSLKLALDFEKYSHTYQIEYLREQLDRPIRICGMVKNEGEPGGGPFWVKHESGVTNLQIIESVQIDTKNNQQLNILKASSHFNPVDIVCGIKNYKGEKYDLLRFIDPKAGFIADKTVDGKPIKALEHPGLWNGAMAHWNTIFVEVPLITFNPVKTVNDLLKPAHQVK